MSASTDVRLPSPKPVRDLLSGLVQPEVSLRPAAAFGVGPQYPATVATFVDRQLVVRVVVVLDPALSIHLGAARARLPRTMVRSALVAQAATPAMSRGLLEVLDAMVPLLDPSPDPQLRVYTAHTCGEALTPQDRSRTQSVGRRADYEVAIAGYGMGRLGFLLT